MSLTKGRIERAGIIGFHDAKLVVVEEGISEARSAGGWAGEAAWERQFKHDVFARIVQTLSRLGWSVMPWKDADKYKAIALNRRTCSKGDLQAELSVSGRCIELEMWQDVQNGENPNGGRYDYDKEVRMTYLQRLEMERTRRRIRDYLCNVFTSYTFKQQKTWCGPDGLTALEWIKTDWRSCWHYKRGIDRRDGEHSSYNNKSADGGTVRHGERVWFADRHGRILVGTAYYNINSMWWVVTGKYGKCNLSCSEIYIRQPGNPRIKRNEKMRCKRLQEEMSQAIKDMNFERAAVLRDILKSDEQRKTA